MDFNVRTGDHASLRISSQTVQDSASFGVRFIPKQMAPDAEDTFGW